MKTIEEITREQIGVMQHFVDGGKVGVSGRDGLVALDRPRWNWRDKEYEMLVEEDPYAHLKLENKFGSGKQIRCKYHGEWCDWKDAGYEWQWTHAPEDYEIQDKPVVDNYAELKLAAKDPTKQIRCRHANNWGDWLDSTPYWVWHLPPYCYEIRDKPKPLRKVKLLAWFDGESLFWRTEGTFGHSLNTRVPSEDKEIEVQDD